MTKYSFSSGTDKNSRRLIIVQRTDGLGGRLLALVRAIRFAEKVDATVRMQWRSLAYQFRDTEATDWHIDDLFDVGATNLDEIQLFEDPSSLDMPPNALVLQSQPQLQTGLRFGFEPEGLFACNPVIATNGQRILRLAGETDFDVKIGLSKAFARLPPSKAVREEAARVQRILGPEPYVALHIRRGDVIANLIDSIRKGAAPEIVTNNLRHFLKRCCPIELMVQSIVESYPTSKVLIFGEDKDSVESAMRMIGSNSAAMPETIGLGPIQNAFVDILAMTAARAIYTTGSQFSRFSAEVGDAALVEIQPAGDSGPWMDFLDRSILSHAGAGCAKASEIRETYLNLWIESANRIERLKTRRGSVVA